MARLFQVQEEERRSIARDLHDEFGQSLAATSALAAVIESSAIPIDPKSRKTHGRSPKRNSA